MWRTTLGPGSPLTEAVRRAEKRMCDIVSRKLGRPVTPLSYGSLDVDPGLLVIWIRVRTDQEKEQLSADEPLKESLRRELFEEGYPEEAARRAFLGFESQETVDRESSGDWWGHFR
ncbi:MAG: hypothetical protein H6721_13540 [Sandaracinus sp.]|nr:hypothetical protein [Myxococcales bacterium]MCB9601488.1 hypothetical protein [Sandaracinus sp.]MCB9633138.1 hypothetical protein [Sandaracinus sp.]